MRRKPSAEFLGKQTHKSGQRREASQRDDKNRREVESEPRKGGKLPGRHKWSWS